MEVVTRRLDELKRNVKNIRRHSNKQIEEYKRSLKKFGQIRPVVADADGVIWCGNGMYDAMVQLGWAECSCYVISNMSENDKVKLMLADNKVFELGITDLDSFEDLISGLGGDFDIPGYDDELLNMIVADTKRVTEEIMDYGNIENADDYKFDPEAKPNYGSTGSDTPYAPVRKDPQTGAFIPSVPVKVEPKPAPKEGEPVEERPFVICPKCGEKIWL